MRRRLIYLLSSIVLSAFSLIKDISDVVVPIDRVAFVFAGTARSLIFPLVYETIRENLVISFCPRASCTADVFIRISTSDNMHDQKAFDAAGEYVPGNSSINQEIKHAISRLNPYTEEGGGGGITQIDWTDIGSEKEKSDMLSSPFTSRRHKIFRTLDPRRYSMYFNRWSAYQLAVQRESQSGVRYTWIVHARLDAAWGEPVRAARDWSQEYVYVPNQWATEVPDTFALLPRKWSDQYFSLDILLALGIMCLGGGNFNPSNLRV
jgi:hypothetical protein